MTPKERVQLELDNLQHLTTSLAVFINGARFKSLPVVQQVLLQVQLQTMFTYGNILMLRLNYWED